MTLREEAAGLLAALERAAQLADELQASPEFAALCERWNTWHSNWRTLPQWQHQNSYYSQPMKLDPYSLGIELALEYDEYDRLHFQETDYDGDKTTGELPMAYVHDPDAWEREQEESGKLVHRTEFEARLAQQTRQVADKARQSMIETLEASGYKVTREDEHDEAFRSGMCRAGQHPACARQAIGERCTCACHAVTS